VQKKPIYKACLLCKKGGLWLCGEKKKGKKYQDVPPVNGQGGRNARKETEKKGGKGSGLWRRGAREKLPLQKKRKKKSPLAEKRVIGKSSITQKGGGSKEPSAKKGSLSTMEGTDHGSKVPLIGEKALKKSVAKKKEGPRRTAPLEEKNSEKEKKTVKKKKKP